MYPGYPTAPASAPPGGAPPYPTGGMPPYPTAGVPPYPTAGVGFPSNGNIGTASPSLQAPPYANAPPLVGGPPPTTSQFQVPPGTQGIPPHMNVNAQGNAPQKTLPTSRVELTVSAKNLIDRDVFSKSDPVCILYEKDPFKQDYFEIGRTEQVKNDLNPSWSTKFTIDYRFEERQIFKFAIYDWDNSSHSVEDQDHLGSLECSLGEIVAAPNNKFERNLKLPLGFAGKSSQLVVHAQELGSNKEILHFKISAKDLDKKDWFGKSDPFVIISKKMDDGSWTKVHKTDVIKNTLNPNWKPFTIRLLSLTSGKPERALKFEVWDWNSMGSSDFIGEFYTSYLEIESKVKETTASFPVINPKKKEKKKGYKDSGNMIFEWVRVEEEKSFLDYIQSGVQMHFTVAVDFTASNGDPRYPNSLHYRDPHGDNQYSLAIKSVGEIIQDYDSDKLFPALGFGAKVPPRQNVSHEFFLNGNPENPYCEGVGGILQAYYNSLNTVELYGPTYFAPVINHVAKFASSYQDGKNYFVLLIITDGIICDFEATKEAIINASALPMSLIIVGVGAEDFSAMEFLDSDDRLLSHNGRSAVRDIVQFVELRKFLAPTYGPQYSQYQVAHVHSKSRLAKEVLAELPEQVVWWMRRKLVKSVAHK